MLSQCTQALNATLDSVPFVLSPPPDVVDNLTKAVNSYLSHFRDMSAEDVVDVFRRRSGELKMKSDVQTKYVVVLEGIRIGLGLSSSELKDVFVIGRDDGHLNWQSDANNNRFGDSLKTAGTRDENLTDLNLQRDEIASAIRLADQSDRPDYSPENVTFNGTIRK